MPSVDRENVTRSKILLCAGWKFAYQSPVKDMAEEDDTDDEESQHDAEIDFCALIRGNRNEWRKAFRLLKRIAYNENVLAVISYTEFDALCASLFVADDVAAMRCFTFKASDALTAPLCRR